MHIKAEQSLLEVEHILAASILKNMQFSFPKRWTLPTEIVTWDQRFFIRPSHCEFVLLDQSFLLYPTFIHKVENTHRQPSCLNIKLFNPNDETASRPLKSRWNPSKDKNLIRVDLNSSLIGLEQRHLLISFKFRNQKLNITPSWRFISGFYPFR